MYFKPRLGQKFYYQDYSKNIYELWLIAESNGIPKKAQKSFILLVVWSAEHYFFCAQHQMKMIVYRK